MEGTIIDNQLNEIKNKIKNIFTPQEHLIGNCPIKDVMDRFGDKWSIYAILLLGQSEKMRFNELRNAIWGISQRMLTVTLRSLEGDGLLERTIYPEIPPRVEYKLTPLGRSLLIQMLQMAEWANDNMQQIVAARKQFASKNEKQFAEN
jgi:DNA-binding HxlR family transcriptional regulator